MTPAPLAGRYRVVGPLPPVGGVPRDLAVDGTVDTQVEISRYATNGILPSGFAVLARRYQTCRHPCLAPVLAIIEPSPGGASAAGSPLIVEAHAEGGPRLTTSVTVPHAAALLVVADLADAVGALHAYGLVHGAVGLDAVVLDAVGRPLLMGAGTRGLQAAALGAPEPALDPADDLRGLGAVLYMLVCGEPPGEPPLQPAMLVPGIAAALNGLILSLLSTDPLRPPPPAGAVALRLRDLAGVGSLHPTTGQPQPSVRPMRPQGRRRGHSDVAIAVASIGIVLAGVLSAYGFAQLDEDAAAGGTTIIRTITNVDVQTEAGVTDTVVVPTGGLSITINPVPTVPIGSTATDPGATTDPFGLPVETAVSIFTVTEPSTTVVLTETVPGDGSPPQTFTETAAGTTETVAVTVDSNGQTLTVDENGQTVVLGPDGLPVSTVGQ